MFRTKSVTSWMLGLALSAALTAGGQIADAASINYGNFGPDAPMGTTVYQDVTESSGTDAVPLFDTPTLVNDTLDFDPKAFVASAVDGAADITDGQLNFTLKSTPGSGIDAIEITESGDFSILGAGSALTMVAAGVSIDIDILEVDGVVLAEPISVFASASMIRDLAGDGPVLLAPWSNGLYIDLAAVLEANDIDYVLGVTMAEIVIDDSLHAISEDGTIAYIAKKDFAIETHTNIPEPASMVLMGLGVVCMLRRH